MLSDPSWYALNRVTQERAKLPPPPSEYYVLDFDNAGRAFVDGGGDSQEVFYLMDRMQLVVYQNALEEFVFVDHRTGRNLSWMDWATTKYDVELRWMGTGCPMPKNHACRAAVFRKIEGCCIPEIVLKQCCLYCSFRRVSQSGGSGGVWRDICGWGGGVAVGGWLVVSKAYYL